MHSVEDLLSSSCDRFPLEKKIPVIMISFHFPHPYSLPYLLSRRKMRAVAVQSRQPF
jgi:hypothetical protein